MCVPGRGSAATIRTRRATETGPVRAMKGPDVGETVAARDGGDGRPTA